MRLGLDTIKLLSNVDDLALHCKDTMLNTCIISGYLPACLGNIIHEPHNAKKDTHRGKQVIVHTRITVTFEGRLKTG